MGNVCASCEFLSHLRLFSREENCSMKVPLSSSLCFTFVFWTPGSHCERGHGLWPLGPGKAWPLGPANGKQAFPTSTNQVKVGLRPRLSCKLVKPSFKPAQIFEEYCRLQSLKTYISENDFFWNQIKALYYIRINPITFNNIPKCYVSWFLSHAATLSSDMSKGFV